MLGAIALPDVLAAAVVVSLLISALSLRKTSDSAREVTEASYVRMIETRLKDCEEDRYRLLDRIGRLLNGGEKR